MRAVAVSVWIFINLVFVGMCGYIYLLWSQYWLYVERQHNLMIGIVNNNNNGFITNNQIIYVQGRSPADDVNSLKFHHRNRSIPKHHSNEKSYKSSVPAAAIRKKAQPRFPYLHNTESDDTVKCDTNTGSGCKPTISLEVDQPFTGDKLYAKVAAHKNQLVVQLRRVLLEESSVFKARGDGSNPYNVQYTGPRDSYVGKSVRELVCDLEGKVKVRTIAQYDEPFRSLRLGAKFPAVKIFPDNLHYNSCGIVTNAGSLYGAGLGEFIDAHDVVLRFNHAPTEGYERDVGTKTTIRIVNSQVVSKPLFGFLKSPLYKGVKLLAWDPSNYTSTLEDWYKDPDFNLFTTYFKHRELFPSTDFHILDPRSQWLLWNYIQSHIPARIRRNPPSSGFLGLALLLPHCSYVDLFEYVPSVRLTKRCHYWDVAEDSSCTFGVWHPLSAEKLLSLALNVADDEAVFSSGYVRVPGYSTLQCP